MPDVDFWEYQVREKRRQKSAEHEQKKAALYNQLIDAIYRSDSAAIDELLENRRLNTAYFDLNQNDGAALSALLARRDYINAVKLIDAGAELIFTHQHTEYDPNDCYPYTKTVIEYVSVLSNHNITCADIYALAKVAQAKLVMEPNDKAQSSNGEAEIAPRKTLTP